MCQIFKKYRVEKSSLIQMTGIKMFNAEKSDLFIFFNDCGACNLRVYSKVEKHIAVDQRILCQKPVHVNPVDIGASV